MKQKSLIWAIMTGTAVFGLMACGIDMPKETNVALFAYQNNLFW